MGFVVVCFLAPAAGQLLIDARPDEWYRALHKPWFNPPGWVFGPVWTLLYASMAVAAWMLWRRRGFRAARIPLMLFALQLVLNAAWTPLFFGLHRPGLAFAEIVLLWLAIAATVAAFFRDVRWAGWLMTPYLAWVSFAAVLNFALWRMNV